MSDIPTPVAGNVFSTDILVRFADCDPVGIVFYPRYFEMFNSVVEDWCAGALDFSFHALISERGLGWPTVHVETDFVAPSRLGDLLRAELRVKKIGGASVTISLRLRGAMGEDRVRGTVVLVLMDVHKARAVPIPAELRARIALFREDDPDQ